MSLPIQQVLKATSSFQCERFFRLHPHGYPKDGGTLHIQLDLARAYWRLYGVRFKHSNKVLAGNFVPSQDTRSMLALLIGGALPVGVMADKFDEEYPETEAATAFLREWEEHERYMNIVPIMKPNRGHME